MQPENKYLRNSLIPGLLKAVSKNPTFDPILIFEIGNIFDKKSEKTLLGVATSGKLSSDFINKAKNLILTKFNLKDDEIKVHELAREELIRFKIKKPLTYVFELELTNIINKIKLSDNNLRLKVSKDEIHYRSVSKYPSLTRDLAFVVDKKVNSNDISSSIYEISELINRVDLFDEFSSDKLGKNKKNLAYHVFLQSNTGTLKDNEANKIIKEIVKKIENKFNAKLRT
jgi:phenylalanyl-tRNA synthetase beta chain